MLICRRRHVPNVGSRQALNPDVEVPMRINVRRVAAGAAVAAGLLAAVVAVPGTAAPNLRPAATTHCVSAAVPAGSSAEVTQAAAEAARCFRTFADAISHATNGTVRLPAGATRVTQQQLDAGRAGI